MTAANLKALFRFDLQTSTLQPAGHNLTPERAVEEVGELESQGLRVQLLDQPMRHKGGNYKTCGLCKTAAENLSQKLPGEVIPEEDSEDAEAAKNGQEEE